MDEPTAALSPVEAKRLFEVVETLRADGAAVVFISHRLEEVFAICQRVTVLRDGKLDLHQAARGPHPRRPRPRDGRARRAERHARGPRRPATSSSRSSASPARACSSTSPSRCAPARWSRWPGSSAPGAPRSRAPSSASTAMTPARSRSRAAALRRGSPTAAMAAGIGFVPEDRRQQGLVMEMSTAHNIALASLRPPRAARAHLAGTERSLRRRLGQAPAGQVRPDLQPRHAALGRQPAEGRAGEVARPRADAADRRRAHARHRRRHQGRGPPPARRAGRRRRGRPGHLLRAARGPHPRRPRARHARGPARGRARARGGHRGAIVAAGTGQAATDRSPRRRSPPHEHRRQATPPPAADAAPRDAGQPAQPRRLRPARAHVRDRRDPGPVRPRHHAHPAELPQRLEHPLRPQRLGALRVGGDRRDLRRPHAQRRPVGRVGGGPLGLRVGQHVPGPPRHRHPGGRSRGYRDRRGLRDRHRAHHRHRPRPQPRGDPGDALHHPRRRHDRRGLGPGRGQLAARLVHQHLPRDDPRDPRSGVR